MLGSLEFYLVPGLSHNIEHTPMYKRIIHPSNMSTYSTCMYGLLLIYCSISTVVISNWLLIFLYVYHF